MGVFSTVENCYVTGGGGWVEGGGGLCKMLSERTSAEKRIGGGNMSLQGRGTSACNEGRVRASWLLIVSERLA